MPETGSNKYDLRSAAKAARRAIEPKLRAEYNTAICQSIAGLPAVQNARVVMSYAALPTELDLDALHKLLAGRGIKLCWPVCHTPGQMQAYSPLAGDSWARDNCGIPAPDPARSALIAPWDIDVVLVPCVAFDADKNRLGWSAGYYDRYLPQCQRAVKIAAAYDVQRVDSIPTDEFDVRMDAVVTERKIYL